MSLEYTWTSESEPVGGGHDGSAGLNASQAGPAPVILQAVDGGVLAVPGGAFLLTADYARIGADLVLTEGDQAPTVVVRDFFALEQAPDLVSEGGAKVAAALAVRLAGSPTPGQYAAEGDVVASEPIGKVVELVGDGAVIRADGTRATLAKDASVYQGDVIETGEGAALKLVFVDESTLAVGENGRMVLDEFVFDAASFEGNSSVSVLQGLFVFVSGEIAQNNPEQMLVKTPVATIGIRGTATAVQAAQEGEENKIILLPEKTEDGQETVGAIRVTNETSSIVLDEAFETTLIDSVFALLLDTYFSSPEEVAFLLHRLQDAVPDSVKPFAATDESSADEEAAALAEVAPAAGPPEGEPPPPEEVIDVTEVNLLETPAFAPAFEPPAPPPPEPINFVAPPQGPAELPADTTDVDDNDIIANEGAAEPPPPPPAPPPPGDTVTLSGLTKLADVTDTASAPVATALGPVQQSGFQTGSFTFTSAGTFLIGVGVVNSNDAAVPSALLIDDVRLNGVLLDGFEAGLVAWQITSGNVITVGPAFGLGPTEGDLETRLFATGTNVSQIDAFFGLPVGTIDGIVDGLATTGSAMNRTINADAGDVLTFSFNFLDIESTQGSEFFDDAAFFVAVEQTNELVSGDQVIDGDDGANSLVGGAGNDFLSGFGGDDTLIGSAGNDVLDGGAGSDSLQGGTDNDTYAFTAADGSNQTDVVDDSGGAVDTLSFDAAMALFDIARSGSNLVIQYGDANSATVADHFGASPIEQLIYDFGDGERAYALSTGHGAGTAGDDIIVGDPNAASALAGDAGFDVLVGRAAGGEILNGGAGNDILVSGGGIDALTGGADADTFTFRGPGEGVAVATNTPFAGQATQVTDFSSGDDAFVFFNEAFGFAASDEGLLSDLETNLGQTLFSMVSNYDGTLALPGATQQFVFDPTTSTLYFDADVNSAGYTVIAQVQSGATVTSSDIEVSDFKASANI